LHIYTFIRARYPALLNLSTLFVNVNFCDGNLWKSSFSGKFLMAAGSQERMDTVEIIALNADSSLPACLTPVQLPFGVHGHAFGMLPDGSPLSCGGYIQQSVQKISNIATIIKLSQFPMLPVWRCFN
jgi:hypothetical protein